MKTTPITIQNVAGRIVEQKNTPEPRVRLVLQFNEKQPKGIRDILKKYNGEIFDNFLTIDYDPIPNNVESTKSFLLNGAELKLEKKNLKKFSQLAELFQIVRKSETGFPIEDKYIGSSLCSENVFMEGYTRMTQDEMYIVQKAHKVENIQSAAEFFTKKITEITSEHFKANLDEVIKGLKKNKLWIR